MSADQTVDANQGWLPLAVRKAPGLQQESNPTLSQTARKDGAPGEPLPTTLTSETSGTG